MSKHLNLYKTRWEAKRSWVRAASDPMKALCTLCHREIRVNHGGWHDLTKHEETAMHRKAALAAKVDRFPITSTSEMRNIAESNVSTVELNGTVQDACVDEKTRLSCWTKAEKILGPASTEEGKEVSDVSAALDLTSLRMWVPPLRLLSASIWQVVQQRQVKSYNRVEEFVSVVLELVPDLLSTEERIELLLGLRTKLVLELCHDQPLPMTDQKMQPHLEKVTRVAESTFSDGEMDQTVDAAVRNFVDLIQALVKSPEYRRHYFQDTYPLHYGQRFDTALQSLVWEFLSRLERLLPTPSFHQVAAWFDKEPLVLEDFLQVVQDPKPLQVLLDHYKDLTHLKSDSSSPQIMTNTILSTLTDSPNVQEVLSACLQKEEGLPLLREQNSQNKSETHGESNDEDCIGEVDEGDPQRDSDEGQNDTSQHDQQSDPEQSSQTCSGLSSSFIVVDWRGDGDDDDWRGDDDDDDDDEDWRGDDDDDDDDEDWRGDDYDNDDDDDDEDDERGPQRDSDEGQNDTSQHDQQSDSEQSSQTPFSDNEVNGTNGLKGRKGAVETIVNIKIVEKGPPSTGAENGASPIVQGSLHKVDNGVFRCIECGKVYAYARCLNKHMKAHKKRSSPTVQSSLHKVAVEPGTRDGRKFRCTECGKAYVHAGCLNNHKKNHTDFSPGLKRRTGETTVSNKNEETGLVSPDEGKVFSPTEKLSGNERTVNINNEQNDPLSTGEENGASPTLQGSLHKVDICPAVMDNGVFRCIECGKVYAYARCLNKHMKACTGETTVSNKNEEISLASSEEGKVLSPTVQDNSQLEKLSANERTVNIDNEQNDPPSTGEENGSSPTVQSSLHKVAVEPGTTEGRKFRCTECGKAYVYASGLDNHKKIHTDLNPDIKRRKIHTGEKRHLCSYCGRAFRQRAYLQEHIKTHTGHRPYECPVCNKRFKQHSNLVSHKRLHTGEKPYLCSYCGKAFTTSGACLHHTRTHTGERPYKCEFCEKAFTMSCHLTAHRRRHTREKPFSCSVCSKRFIGQHELKKHMRIHTGEKPYVCLICGMKFADSTGMRAHQRSHRS